MPLGLTSAELILVSVHDIVAWSESIATNPGLDTIPAQGWPSSISSYCMIIIQWCKFKGSRQVISDFLGLEWKQFLKLYFLCQHLLPVAMTCCFDYCQCIEAVRKQCQYKSKVFMPDQTFVTFLLKQKLLWLSVQIWHKSCMTSLFIFLYILFMYYCFNLLHVHTERHKSHKYDLP